MSDDEKRKLIGCDGLIEFGQYLNGLHEGSYRDYTFEMREESEIQECSLDEVIREFQSFFDSKRDFFLVRIKYVDYQMGTIGYTEKEFRRLPNEVAN